MENDNEFMLRFKSTFRGREDVIARHWKSEDRAGYTPICRNDGRKDICQKPCKDCCHKDYVPWDDDLLTQHFRGDGILGVYPLLQDNSCWFLAADFDDHDGTRNPRLDVRRFYDVCLKSGITTYMLRSKSGRGYHCYLFFDQPVPAWKARRVVEALIKEVEPSQGHEAPFSFDRLFPSQDKLSEDGGLGNLIALPWQGKVIEAGHTVFLNPETGFQEPYEDQFAVFRSLSKLSEYDLDRIIQERPLVRQTGIAMEVKKIVKPEVAKSSSKITKGRRNTTLTSEPGALRRKGAEYKEILSKLEEAGWREARGSHPFSIERRPSHKA